MPRWTDGPERRGLHGLGKLLLTRRTSPVFCAFVWAVHNVPLRPGSSTRLLCRRASRVSSRYTPSHVWLCHDDAELGPNEKACPGLARTGGCPSPGDVRPTQMIARAPWPALPFSRFLGATVCHGVGHRAQRFALLLMNPLSPIEADDDNHLIPCNMTLIHRQDAPMKPRSRSLGTR